MRLSRMAPVGVLAAAVLAAACGGVVNAGSGPAAAPAPTATASPTLAPTPTPTETPTPAPPPQPATTPPPQPATAPPAVNPPPRAFNDGDADNRGGPNDGDGNG